jgi:predicted transcriptional regulator
MYESITYAELKKLPSAEKPEAWKELKSLYKTQKELADKLGVSPAIVYNMVSRYAGGEKKSKLELVEAPRKTRTRMKKKVEKTEKATAVQETKPVLPEIRKAEESESFSIAIKKAICGEDARFLLNGIGNTLLKDQKYMIEVRIIEK